jgi:hypothetical protein
VPYTTVVAGTTITASWGNANVRDQVVTPFASASARSSAITSPIEGMVTFRQDENVLEAYDGSNWTPAGWIPIASTTLGSPASSVSWTSVPQTYKNLMIVANCRTTEVATASDILLRFNNDTNADYANLNITADNASGTAALAILGGNAQTSTPAMRTAGGNLNSAIWGGGFAYVLGYSNASTANKQVYSFSGEGDFGSVAGFRLRQATFSNANSSFTAIAVTRIDLIAGGSSNFSTGSTFQLYGFGA